MDGNEISLDAIPKDGDRLMNAISQGQMIIARSNNDFLYVLKSDNEFHLFSHSPGQQNGGKKTFPVDEKYTAIIRNIANVATSLFQVEFDNSFNIYNVMASAEEGILSMYPGDNRDGDEDIEFMIPEETV